MQTITDCCYIFNLFALQIWTDAEFAVLHSQQPKLSARELAVLCVMERRVTDRLAYLCTMAETTSSSIVSEADSISVYDELRAAGSLQLDITLDEVSFLLLLFRIYS